MRLAYTLLVSLLGVSFSLRAWADDAFDPAEVPKGAKVTIAQPAVTQIPLGMLVNFDATDRSQALRLKPVVQGSQKPVALKIYIYDSTEKEVKVVNVNSDSTVFYNFKSLNTVSVRPELVTPELGIMGQVRLMVESNRPATIYH